MLNEPAESLDELSDTEYFDQFTGIKNHSLSLNGWYPTIHSTRLRLNYTYYNNQPVMQRIFAWYDAIDPEGMFFDYTIIDDGSQDYPLMDYYVPDHWSVIHIPKDMGWNNEGARNCLMRETQSKWNLMLDSDWVVTLNNLMTISRALPVLDEAYVYMPGNYGPSVGRNSYLVTKDEFTARGGYDQAFIGYHGNDYSFLRFGLKYDYSEFFWFSRLVKDVINPQDKNRLEEVKKFHKQMLDLEAQGLGKTCDHDHQDFEWKDEESHLTHWKSIDYIVIR